MTAKGKSGTESDDMTTNDRLKQELIEQFGTPCAVIDLDIVDRNIAHLQSLCDAAGLANRPHIKTHKSPVLARRQLDAGAIGITCQKLGEAEVMAEAGIEDILIATNIIGAARSGRLAALQRRMSLKICSILYAGWTRSAGSWLGGTRACILILFSSAAGVGWCFLGHILRHYRHWRRGCSGLGWRWRGHATAAHHVQTFFLCMSRDCLTLKWSSALVFLLFGLSTMSPPAHPCMGMGLRRSRGHQMDLQRRVAQADQWVSVRMFRCFHAVWARLQARGGGV